jgi:NDP-sugar pyrophosphorylase family protein
VAAQAQNSAERSLPPVCILAGGRGTRLGDAVTETPKPLLEVADEPFIVHQLRLLRSFGARRIVLSVGYLGEQFEAALGDGSFYDVELSYVNDGPELLGTAGAVRGCLPVLGDEFMVMYGDSYLRIDYGAVHDAFTAAGTLALLTVLRNAGRWDTSNTEMADGVVVVHDKQAPTPAMEWIDYGLSVMTAAALDASDDPDLNAVFKVLAQRGELAAFEASERFYEIGTPQALAETDAFLRSL